MKTPPLPDTPFPVALFAPLTHWAAGFEYAFGYQLRLIWDFWGFTDDAR